jgi:hypothetical protein
VGVSRSAVSRQAIQASVEQLKQLQERRWDQVEILVIYIDGLEIALRVLAYKLGRTQPPPQDLETLKANALPEEANLDTERLCCQVLAREWPRRREGHVVAYDRFGAPVARGAASTLFSKGGGGA